LGIESHSGGLDSHRSDHLNDCTLGEWPLASRIRGDWPNKRMAARDGWAPEGWKSSQEENEETGDRDDHWRPGELVSRGEGGVGSRRATSVGRNGIQTQQGIPTDRAE
jgi:hypothetical protein